MKIIRNKRQETRDKKLKTGDWMLDTGTYMRGQGLIEVLIAFAVVALVGMALIAASLATQRTSISARSKSQANELAQQYLEQVRVIRDVKGFSYIGSGCFTVQSSQNSDPSTWALTSGTLAAPQSGGCNVGTVPNIGEVMSLNNINYYRSVNFTTLTTTAVKAVVTVAWTEGINARSVSQETILSKWCGGQVSIQGTPCP